MHVQGDITYRYITYQLSSLGIRTELKILFTKQAYSERAHHRTHYG